ncbi:MAG: glutathione S-transferase family protein [Proteobacteria bacterium]|nr:glutathione S-transferase family protein [Pseudomonadota bacterium]
MRLYGFTPSPNTWKVRAFADHIGVPLEYVFVDLRKGEQRKPDYLAVNPSGRTPTLVDGDFTLWESNAIQHYIGASKTTDLWPQDACTRADIMRWQSWQLTHWASACEPMIFERLVKRALDLGAPDAAVLAKAQASFANEAGILDAHLATREYLVADRLTLADFAVASYLLHAEAAELPLAAHGNVARWFATVAALPAWKNTAPAM